MESRGIFEGESDRTHSGVVDQFEQSVPIRHKCSECHAAMTNFVEACLRILDLSPSMLGGY
jgi:hypothetical protein